MNVTYASSKNDQGASHLDPHWPSASEKGKTQNAKQYNSSAYCSDKQFKLKVIYWLFPKCSG